MKVIQLIVCLLVTTACSSQNIQKLYLHFGVNLTAPYGETRQTMFPIVGYDKTITPKLLIGGLNLGLTHHHKLGNRLYLNTTLSFARHTTWEGILRQTDVQGNRLGDIKYNKVDYVLKLVPTVAYSLTDRLTAGIGIGTNISLFSISPTPETVLFGEEKKAGTAINKYNRLLNPVIPLELKYYLNKMFFGARFEYAPFNSNRSDLADVLVSKKNYINFEVGYKLR